MTRWFDPALQNLVIGEANTTFDGSETTLISQGGSVREISLSTISTDILSSPVITGHPTVEGVTSTGATGTGKIVFDASPTLSGDPKAPTASVDDNDTSIATTAFVIGQAGTATPAADSGSGSAGSSLRYSRQDHAHPLINSGTLTAGTTCTQNPFSATTKTTQAHGLGTTPHIVVFYLECLTAEHGYSTGDRLKQPNPIGGANTCPTVEYDSTNVSIITTSSITAIDKTTPGTSVALTAANWKVVAVPYKIN